MNIAKRSVYLPWACCPRALPIWRHDRAGNGRLGYKRDILSEGTWRGQEKGAWLGLAWILLLVTTDRQCLSASHNFGRSPLDLLGLVRLFRLRIVVHGKDPHRSLLKLRA